MGADSGVAIIGEFTLSRVVRDTVDFISRCVSLFLFTLLGKVHGGHFNLCLMDHIQYLFPESRITIATKVI